MHRKRMMKILWCKAKEVSGDWRQFHNEELHGLYSSPNTVSVIVRRTVRWTGHVARSDLGVYIQDVIAGAERKRQF